MTYLMRTTAIVGFVTMAAQPAAAMPCADFMEMTVSEAVEGLETGRMEQRDEARGDDEMSDQTGDMTEGMEDLETGREQERADARGRDMIVAMIDYCEANPEADTADYRKPGYDEEN
ncbi:hypothetical protein [Roseovarius sp. TE539]|uniref:hypothetical protein n=1 Tax=Roseovarius sp. TE539 TaxID=2249812 RepID=UPI000DDF7E04|nr:hypothetical protein [Roseovarius sp. TE539]